MRRFLFGVVIAAVSTTMPAWAFGGDREIAQSLMAELKQHKAAGNLKGFDIDLKVEDGIVYLTGQVASRAQRALVAKAATKEVGEANLVNELTVRNSQPPRQVKPQFEPASRPKVKLASTSRNSSQPNSQPKRSSQPSPSDVAVTDSLIARLQQSKSAGALRGFELDVSTVNGDVWLRGKVANQTQKDHVLDIARRTRGVARVIDDIVVAHGGPVRQVSTGGLAPAVGAPAPIPQGSSMPNAGRPVPIGGTPQAFAPSGLASMSMGGGMVSSPVPMQGAGAQYGVGAPRYDQPNMPSYAWPSYAAYPNYSAVTYPKQYSPSAWPYIGPFYPYPQVPLGWRKVSLEWDDGLWYLDFTSK